MKIGDLFRGVSVNPTGKADNSELGKNIEEQETRRVAGVSEDRVTISSEAKKFARIAKIVEEDDVARQERIAELKRQVESGEYNVASQDVANALVAYSRNGR